MTKFTPEQQEALAEKYTRNLIAKKTVGFYFVQVAAVLTVLMVVVDVTSNDRLAGFKTSIQKMTGLKK